MGWFLPALGRLLILVAAVVAMAVVPLLLPGINAPGFRGRPSSETDETTISAHKPGLFRGFVRLFAYLPKSFLIAPAPF